MEARTAVSSDVFNVEARTAVSSDVFDVGARTSARTFSTTRGRDVEEYMFTCRLPGRRPHEQTNGLPPDARKVAGVTSYVKKGKKDFLT